MADLELKIGATLDEQTKTAFQQLEKLMISLGTGNAKNILNNIFSGATKDIDKFHLSLEKLKSKSGELLDKGAMASVNKAIGQLKFHQTLAMKTVNDLMKINLALEKSPDSEKLLYAQRVAVGKLSRADTRLTDAKTGVSRAFISAEESIQAKRKYEAEFTALLREEEKKRLADKKKYEDEFNKLVRDEDKKKVTEKKKKIQEVNTFDKQQYDALVQSKVDSEKKQRDIQRAKNQSIADAIKERVKQETLDKKSLDSQKEQLAKQKEYAKILNDINGKYKNRYAMQKAIQVKKQEILALEKKGISLSDETLIKKKNELKVLTQIHDATRLTMADALHNTFSMSKIINRMSFVLTAQLSYAVFGQISRFFSEGLRDAKAFEQQLTRIASITRGQNQGIIRQSAMQAIGMGFTSADTTQALYQATSGQFSTAESAKLASESARMAVAGFTSQAEAMDALITVLRSYKMETSDAGRVSDWFFKTIELGKTELKDLAPNLGKVTSVASLLGFSLDEVGAVLSTMTMAGVKTNVAITSMRQLLLNLTNPSKEASKIYAQYGINMDLSRIRAQGLGETLKQLNVLNDEQIATLAGSRTGYLALASVMNNMSMYQENYNKIVDAGGSSQKAFQDQTETTAFKLNKMRGTLVRAGMEFGEVLIKLSFVLKPFELLVTGLNNNVATSISLLSALSLVMYTKVIPAIQKMSVAMRWTSAGVVAIGLLIMAWGKYTQVQREAQQASQDAIDAKVSELSKERGELGKNNEMLKTYIGLKEREADGENLTKKEKDLLRLSQIELNKTYGNSLQSIDDYRERMKLNIKTQRELSKEITDLSLLMSRSAFFKQSSKRDYNKEWRKNLSPEDNEKFEDKAVATYNRKALSILSAMTNTSQPESARENVDFLKTLDEGLGGLESDFLLKIEGYINDTRIKLKKFQNDKDEKGIRVSEVMLSTLEQSKKRYLSGIKKYSEDIALAKELLSQKKALSSVQRQIIDEDIDEIKTSGGDYQGEVDTAESDARTAYEAQKEKYRLLGNNLKELIEARTAYINVIKDANQKEKEGYSTQNEMIDLINTTSKDILSAEKLAIDKKSQDIKAVNDVYDKIIAEYKARIKKIQEVAKDADYIRRLEAEILGFETERKGMLDKINYNALEKEAESSLEKVLKVIVDGDSIVMKSPSDVLAEKDSVLNKFKETLTAEQLLPMGDDFIEKQSKALAKEYNDAQSEIVSNAIKDVKTTTFKGSFIGGMTPEEIKKSKLKALEDTKGKLPPEDVTKFKIKIEQEYQQDITDKKKKADEMTLAETKTLISNMSQMWDSYLDNRLAQIEKESQARLESIDKQAKFEFKSSLWVESQKEKVAKKEEVERKKIAKLRKLTNMSELTSNYAVAMMTAYKQLGWGAPLLMALMTANYGMGMKMISSQKYEQGGIIKGRRHSQGGVLIEAEGGEAIFSRKATAGNEATLSGMNKSLSNGASFNEAVAKNAPRANNSGQNQTDMSKMAKMLSGVVDAVKDIKMNVVLQGEFLDNIKLSKKVEQGNRMRSVL